MYSIKSMICASQLMKKKWLDFTGIIGFSSKKKLPATALLRQNCRGCAGVVEYWPMSARIFHKDRRENPENAGGSGFEVCAICCRSLVKYAG